MKKASRALALLALSAAVCVLCNFAACFVDTPRMRENAAQALDMLSYQDMRPEVVGGFASAQLDNYSSVIILKTAVYTGSEPLVLRALGGLRAEFFPEEGEDSFAAFFRYGDGSETGRGGFSYARYWHGYMLPLRLLLCRFSLPNLQMLFLFLQGALLAEIVVLLERRGLGVVTPGFLTAYFLMMPAAMALCPQYVPASLLTLLGSLAVLRWDEAIARAVGLPGFFALLGLWVNYFDLLTFPLTTLGFPLALCLCLRMRGAQSSTPPRSFWAFAPACCLAWGLGYGGMWAFKWLLDALLLDPALLAGIFDQAALRVSSISNLSRLSVIGVNLRVLLDKQAYLLLLPLGAAATLARTALSLRRRKGTLCLRVRALALLVPLALPFAWCATFSNHSFDHSFFTYRIFAVAALSAYALLAFLPEKREKG